MKFPTHVYGNNNLNAQVSCRDGSIKYLTTYILIGSKENNNSKKCPQSEYNVSQIGFYHEYSLYEAPPTMNNYKSKISCLLKEHRNYLSGPLV